MESSSSVSRSNFPRDTGALICVLCETLDVHFSSDPPGPRVRHQICSGCMTVAYVSRFSGKVILSKSLVSRLGGGSTGGRDLRDMQPDI